MTFRKCLSSSRSDCRDADRTDPNGKYNYIHNGIDEPGRYIATVHFAGGEEVRYGIVAESSTPHFYYSLRIREEKLFTILDLGAETKLERHVLPKNAEQIAAITRDPGTNLFRADAKKTGSFDIKFPDDNDHVFLGIPIDVEQLSPIMNIGMYKGYYVDH